MKVMALAICDTMRTKRGPESRVGTRSLVVMNAKARDHNECACTALLTGPRPAFLLELRARER